MLLLCVPAALATTYVVDPAGGGDTTTIRAAVNLAVAGDVVQVRAGSYSEPLTLSRGITLEGVDGSANTFLSARTSVVPLTISADVTLRGFTLEAPGVTALHITTGAVSVEDVTVVNSGDRGGATDTQAVSVDAGTVSFSSCAFSDNAGYYGGHVAIFGDTVATFAGCVFTGGSGGQGGALSVDGGAVATITDCRFEANDASTYGGALLVRGGGEVLVEGSSFDDNTSNFGDGGAVLLNPGADVTFSDVDFNRNMPGPWDLYGYGGGAISAQSATLTLEDVRFLGNEGWYGGAVWMENGELDLSTVRFEGNVARYGGALRLDGADLVDYASDYVDNVAEVDGGAVSAGTSTLSLSAAGFSGNAAAGDGGAVWVDTSSLRLQSVAVEANTATGDGGGLASAGGSVDLDGVYFSENRAGGRGGGLTSTGDALDFVNVSLWGNVADLGGGAAVDAATSWTEQGSSWRDNTADSAGGALWARDTTVLLDGTIAEGNSAFYGDGGTVALEGGSLSAVGIDFGTGLAAGSGGHIHASDAPVDLSDATLVDGFAVWGDGGAVWGDAGGSGTRLLLSGKAERGGGVALVGGRTGDRWRNVAVLGAVGGAIYAEDHPGLVLENDDLLGGDGGVFGVGGAIELRDSVVAGMAGPALSAAGTVYTGGYNLFFGNDADVAGDLGAPPGAGNIDADPRLVDWSDDGDARNDLLVPRPASPLLDAGDPASTDPDGSRADIGVTGGAAAQWSDRDQDGSPSGLDCDDGDAGVHPGAAEAGYDGLDQDCDGLDFDADGDGHDATEWGGDDCDDADPWVVGDCAGETTGDDTGPGGTTDSGDSGIAVSGTGVVRTDACGCGGGIPAAGLFGLTTSLLFGRRRKGR